MDDAKQATKRSQAQHRTLSVTLASLVLAWTSGGCNPDDGTPLAPVTAGNPDNVALAPGSSTSMPSPVFASPGIADAGSAPDEPAGAANLTTYTEHVRPILARSCVPCHSQGQIAPFSLESYERAKPFAPLIAKATRARTMPPSVVDNSGACNTFRDLPWLTDAEIETLERWSAQGAPEGNSALPPPPLKALPKLSGDVRTIKTPSYVPSTKMRDDWRCFVVDSPFKEKTFITGFDTRPGDKKTAHHMVVFYPMDDLSALLGKVLDDLDPEPGYTCYGSPGTPATVLAAWAPGGGATLYPDKLGIEVEPNRPLIVQMHYNTVDSPMPGADVTAIDLQVQKEGISPGIFTQVLDLEMNLPPGKKDAEEVVRQTMASKRPEGKGPIQVYGVFPHMHELGRTQRLSVAGADGKERCMVDVPRYDFHWQRMYFFDKPMTIDAADELSVRCVFDTTSRSEVTKWGESTQDEMCVVGLFMKL